MRRAAPPLATTALLLALPGCAGPALRGVELPVSDADAARAFYAALLDAEPAEEPLGIVFVAGRAGPGSAAPVLRVADLEAALRRAAAAGAVSVGRVEQDDAGRRRARLVDPFGNALVLRDS